MSSRSRSRTRTRSKPQKPHANSFTVYGPDHERYNEESKVYDAITRAVIEYNHRMVGSNIQLGPLQQVDKNRLYVVCPFITTEVKSFRQLAEDISKEMHAEVDISAEVDIDQDAQIHLSFNILRDSCGRKEKKQGWLQYLLSLPKMRTVQILLLLILVWFIYA